MRRGPVAVLALLTLMSGLLVLTAPASSAEPAPPKVVTAADVVAAANNKAKLASIVGQLGAEVAQSQIQLSQSLAKYQVAEQKAALALSKQQQAETAAAKARRAVVVASAKAQDAHNSYVDYVQAAYYGEGLDGTAGSLLTADNPNDLLEKSTLQRYQADNKIDAVAKNQLAQVTKSNSEGRARVAEAVAQKATAAAKVAVKNAQADYANKQTQQVNLQNQKDQQQSLLNLAAANLRSTQTAHANYVAYLAEQARIAAAAKAAREAAARKAEAERRARERARQQQQQNSGGSSGARSPSGGGSSDAPGPPAPRAGGWTKRKGELAAQRALSLLGHLYIFAGGNKYGPTAGGCTDPIAPCGTLGYDCSGLVLYAWYQDWAHYAATQYSQAGSYHPSSSDFLPGDLLFWSENGTIGGIGHVAVYIGNGNVVQAPQSGDVVKITPWYAVEAGYYGATRPLT